MRILIKEKLSEHKSKTPEGYLICQDAILARTGTQDYLKSEIYENFDGEDSVVSVERKPEQVFSAEALASFEDKPITVEHPDENVNPDNYSELAVGHTRNIRKGKFNGQDVMIGDLVITDAQTIEDIENGVRTELSCGYDCDITEGDHPEQINIRGNHVALCEQGRAGIAKIIDSASKLNDTVINRFDEDNGPTIQILSKKIYFDAFGVWPKEPDKIWGTAILETEKAWYVHMVPQSEWHHDNGWHKIPEKNIWVPKSLSKELSYSEVDQMFGINLDVETDNKNIEDSDELENMIKACQSVANDFTEEMTNAEEKTCYNSLFKLVTDIVEKADKEMSSAKLLDLSKVLESYASRAKNLSAKTKLIALAKELYRCYDRNRKYSKDSIEDYKKKIIKTKTKDVLKNPKNYNRPTEIIVNNAFSHEIERLFGSSIISKEVLEKNKIKYIIPYNSQLEYLGSKHPSLKLNILDSKNSLDPKDKKQLSKYLAAISKHMSNDISIEDIINPIKEMGYNPVRMKIDGWDKMDDGYYRKDYFFTFDNYDDIFIVSLYAKGNGDWTTDEVNAYFTGKRNMNDSILQEYEMIRRSNEAKYGKDFMEYVERYLSLPENSQIIENKWPSGYIEKRPKVLLSDLYYNEEEWNKFMNWYKNEKVSVTDERPDDAPLRVCRNCLMAIEAHEGKLLTRHLYIDEDDEEGSKCDWCEETGFDELWEILDTDEKILDSLEKTDCADKETEKTPWTVMYGWITEDKEPYSGTAIVYAKSEDEAKEILKSYQPKATHFRVKAGRLVNSFDYPTYFVSKEKLYEEDDEVQVNDATEYKTIVMSELGPEMVYEENSTITVQFPAEADAERALKASKLGEIPYDEYEDESAYYVVMKKEDIRKVFKPADVKKDSAKYVLYIEDGKIKGTNMENYNAEIRNAHSIIDFSAFKTFEDCINYLLKYTKLKREDIVTIGDTEIEDIRIHDNNYPDRFYKKSLKELKKKLKNLDKFDDAEFDDTASEYNSQKNSIYKEIENQIKCYEEKLMKDDMPLTEETKIKEWYVKTFPTDDKGEEIDEKVTFNDLFECLDNHQDVYKCIGVGDSVIRERCFEALAKVIGSTYKYIYDQWLK